MNKITAVIIEDEIPAARRLNNTLNLSSTYKCNFLGADNKQ